MNADHDLRALERAVQVLERYGYLPTARHLRHIHDVLHERHVQSKSTATERNSEHGT